MILISINDVIVLEEKVILAIIYRRNNGEVKRKLDYLTIHLAIKNGLE